MKKQSISNIRDIGECTNIQQLSEYHNILLTTCRDVISQNNYEDIVQAMYIKAHKYFMEGKVLSPGYIFLIMKSINLNSIKKENRYDLENGVKDVEDIEYDEIYYDNIDKRIEDLDNKLKEYLTQEEIALFKFYKLNTLKITARYYSTTDSIIKNKISKIYTKIRLNGGL